MLCAPAENFGNEFVNRLIMILSLDRA